MINTSIKVIILFKLPNFLTPFFYFSFVFWGRRSPHDQEICQSAQCPRGDEGLTRLSREINRHTLLCPPIPLPPIPPLPVSPLHIPPFRHTKRGVNAATEIFSGNFLGFFRKLEHLPGGRFYWKNFLEIFVKIQVLMERNVLWGNKSI